MNDHNAIIRDIRSFNRFYTDIIGLLDQHLLDSPYALVEARILFEINNAGNIQASQIIDKMHIDKSYLSRLLKKLEKDKLIIRKRSGNDARAVILSLTEKGEKEFGMLNKASNEQINNLIAPLSNGQKKKLGLDMSGIMEALKPGKKIKPDEINIRTTLLPGDLGYIAFLHGKVYAEECSYGLNFEGYVLESLGEFAHQYNPYKDRVWICEHLGKIVGFLAAVNRGQSAQLRYFILLEEYRGMGLGKKLMDSFMEYLKEQRLSAAYLWTTNEQQTATALYKRYGFQLTEEKPSKAFDKELTEQRYDLIRSDLIKAHS
ncbi:helix-turn-helix domain-containing GNAT family N-acetyltransferase [Mucilaginibacter sp.]|jgi:DNA-binding MarR family transcriptional regulator/ribosomal protein S18 acetylase RimI-like enzyme|uniref:bifunctional helix-turn-helix transcriptional regulator/GNAT family N-acetyltransferase n=1 Tax=Mucilaginibacter sp. TaxID=1882438 RepID=UPI002CE644D5|nr:helix-turn-helix domain-containing GNAT family N-acetyltransferase [Mucilaginibacter sp.]HTI57960.1 helix-turn-helix domain-containing GNAT family N-acetyltransferase [Mucilaginibacter sp.]